MRERNVILNTSMHSIGTFIFCAYIATVYLAQDLFLPASLNSVFLHLFWGWGILNIILSKRIKVYDISMWILVFMAFGLISMLYSPVKGILTGQFYITMVNFVIILFLSQINFTKRFFCQIGWTYVVSSIVLILWMILSGNMSDSAGRLGTDVFGNANSMATLLMTATLYSFFLLVYEDSHGIKKIILIAGVALNYYAMFLSGGRKFVIVPMVFLYILLLFKTDSEGRKHAIKYTAIIITVAAIVYLLIMNVPTFYEVIGWRMEGLLNLLLGTGEADFSTVSRVDMIDYGLEQWLQSPIWGYGFDSFKYYYGSITGVVAYSHNNYVELLFNLGIAGFLIYYAFYFRVIIKGFSLKNNIPVYAKAFSIAVIIACLVYEFGAVTYSSTSTIVMIYMSRMLQEHGMLCSAEGVKSDE